MGIQKFLNLLFFIIRRFGEFKTPLNSEKIAPNPIENNINLIFGAGLIKTKLYSQIIATPIINDIRI